MQQRHSSRVEMVGYSLTSPRPLPQYSRVTVSYSPISHPANSLSAAILQLVKLT
jgi:hypothetical protein